VQTSQPVNRFSDFVRYMVRRLKVPCPLMGIGKMAETLCRAGLHLSTTTVGRMFKEPPTPSRSGAVRETGALIGQ
jgi:hypothetical protein